MGQWSIGHHALCYACFVYISFLCCCLFIFCRRSLRCRDEYPTGCLTGCLTDKLIFIVDYDYDCDSDSDFDSESCR